MFIKLKSCNKILKREVTEIRKRKEYELDILSSKIHNLEEVTNLFLI